MRMTLKRLTAWMLTLMMIVGCVPASAVEGSVVDYSAATSAYDVMPLADETTTNDITVTFVIANEEYTCDPGSQNTHVTAKAEIAGGDLTYTSWASRYKVTRGEGSTGTVCSYTIPAGTSLADNGYSLPALSIENIGNTNTYTYYSSYSWISAANMLCSVDTVFNEDTTLHMQLYVNGAGEEYSVDFVCGEDNHSIKTSHYFMLGQSLSQAHIDAATEAANAFTSQWCTHGPASGEQLQKWQLKVTSSGDMVDLTAGMAITNAYVDEQYGNAIKAYAVWEAAPATVTATFQYASSYDETTGDPVYTTVESRELNSGDALGTLPDMTTLTPEGSTFIGWQYTDADGNLMYATAETVINADATYTAVFGTLVTATFKYIAYDEATDTDVEQIIETRQLNAGDALGTLPDMSAYENPLWVLAGWYNEADAENEEIEYVTADTVVTENVTYIAEFSYPECGYVTLIDILPDGSIREGIEPNISLPVGMTIAEGIAANEEYDGFALTDDTLASACIWRTADGELADLTEVVTAETDISLYTYTYQIILTLNPQSAAEAAGIMTLSLVETDTAEDGTITMTITAREGETLTEEDLTVNGTDLTQYAWTDSEGNAVDLQALVDEGVTENITATSDGTLAAVEYTLTLELTLDGVTKSYTITKEEGVAITAEDCVIDGLDLSVFTWTNTEGATVSLVGTALLNDFTVTSTGTLNNTLYTGTNEVNFYVYIDNVPYKVATRTVTSYRAEESTNEGVRRYISAATLASVYGEYGFSASDLTATSRYFPHKDTYKTTLWADQLPIENNGMCYSPIVLHGNAADVYYLPNQTITSSAEYNDTNTANANSFYTVTVNDAAGLVYTADELPESTLTLVGGTTSMTVKAKDGVTWQCIGQEDNATVDPVDNGDGTLTFTINAISQPYVISTVVPSDSVVVQYDRNLQQTPSDQEYGVPMINGEETYTDVVLIADAKEYKALALNPSSYLYENGKKYQGEAVFLGWAVNGNTAEGSLIPAGGTVDLSVYGGQIVTLTAQWEEHVGGQVGDGLTSSMVNFFVSYNAISEGSSAWLGQTKEDKFTESVYTMDCGVIGQDVIDHRLYTHEIDGEDGQYAVIGDTSGGNLNDAHDEIVDKLTAGYIVEGKDAEGNADGRSFTFTGTFPSDEHVLRTIRQMMAADSSMSITINGRNIEASELTTRNFTVKWYVFKVATGTNPDAAAGTGADGWHIDGILVAKKGKMIVTKTFAGDEEAINSIKQGYTIDVTATGNEETAVNASAQLAPNNATAYDGYNTYTWEVDVDQYFDYTLTENSYIFDENATVSKAQYRVRNSDDSTQNTSGWQTYSSSGVGVTGRGYNETDSSDILRVDFLNTYTAPGTVVIQKIDAVTGNLMPNVTFEIGGTHASGSTLQLYHVDGSHYSVTETTGTLTDTITTDSSGQAYLWIGGGNYWLKEAVPTGYDDPGTISIALEGASDNSYKVVAITSATAANDTTDKSFVSVGGEGELTLTVKNYSRTIDLKVTKDWKNDEDKPVTIQLYGNGRSLGSSYAVTLDGSEGWTHTFTGLPLYADGALAQYTIREESIGTLNYSDAFPTGYLYYDVDYSAMKYLDAEGNVTTDMTQVKTIALEVSNDRNHGSLSLGKVDNNNLGLANAVFYLYEVPTGSTAVPTVSKDSDELNVLSGYTKVDEATSTAAGIVDFGDVDAGRYYLIEHSAPDGYVGSDQVYLVQFDGTNVTMQYYDSDADAWTTMASRVVNQSETIDIPVTKNWVDGSDANNTRPAAITVVLTGTANGSVVSTTTARITADNGDNSLGEDGTAVESNTWLYTFEDMPTHYAGYPITYTISEYEIVGYTGTYDQGTEDEIAKTITNTLLSNITYTVSKQVEGNFADPNKEFAFTAEIITADGDVFKTVNFSLKHGETFTVSGIPYGATVKVTEDPDGYTAQYMLGTDRYDGASYTSGIILDSSQGVTFINTKNITIDTGVDLDTLPYLLTFLGAFGAGALWLMISRRRRTQA